MHPALITALATEHRADLLRGAESRRRAAALPHRGGSAPSKAVDTVAGSVARLWHRAATAWQPTPQTCCA